MLLRSGRWGAKMTTFQNGIDQKSLFRWANSFGAIAAVAGLLAFVAVTWFGFGKEVGSWGGDFTWYFAGGKCFLAGSNMYAVECVGPIVTERHGYSLLAGLSYPPHFAPFTLLTALLPIFHASVIFYIVNVFASLFMAWIVSKTAARIFEDGGKNVQLNHGWALLLVMGSTGIWATVWLGQVTVLIAICFWVAFRQIQLGKELVPAILLALASVKPQIAALVFLWVLLHGRYRILALAALTAAVLSINAFVQMGVIPALEGWIEGVTTYQSYPVNQLGNNSIMGIPSFLAILGIDLPIWAGLAMGVAFVIFLRVKSSIDPFSLMALSTILLVQMVVFSRPTDLILIAPVFALFWPSNRSSAFNVILFLTAVAVYCFPQQLVVKALPHAAAGHFRTLLLVAMLIAFVRQMLQGFERFEDKASDRPTVIIQTA